MIVMEADSTPIGSRPSRTWQVARIVALGLIGFWGLWWAENARRDALVDAGWTRVPALPVLAADFKVHIDHVARIAASGIDPYRKSDDPVCQLYPYPPMIARTFSWVVLFDTRTAAILWLSILAVIYVTAGLWAFQVRRTLGITEIPRAVLVAAMLFGLPSLLAIERGQCDPIVIPALLLAAWLLDRRSGEFWSEIAAGGLLGATAWLKYYPGLTAIALVALGRRRGLAAFVVVAGVIGVVDREGVVQSIRNGQKVQAIMTDPVPFIHETKHSIVESWRSLKVVRRIHLTRQIPGTVAAALILIPAVFGVSRVMSRTSISGSGPLIGPFLLWLTAAGTFGMPYALDYNLVPLSVVILAVCDHRDRRSTCALLALSLLAWAPFRLPVDGQILFVLKVAALLISGACLATRVVERSPKSTPPRGRELFLHGSRRSVRARGRESGVRSGARGRNWFLVIRRPCIVPTARHSLSFQRSADEPFSMVS